MPNIPSLKILRQDPLYRRIKGRSKMSAQDIHRHLLELHKANINMRTSIFSDAPMEANLLLPFLDTKQKGRYSRLSKQSHHLTAPKLRTEKLDRILLSIYDWFHEARSPEFTLHYIFTDPSSLVHYYLDKSKSNVYSVEFRYVSRKDLREETLSKKFALSKTDDNLYMILKTFALMYTRYEGQCLNHASNTHLLKKGRLSAQDMRRIQAIHHSEPIYIHEWSR